MISKSKFSEVEVVSFDFFNTLVFQRRGQGRGRTLLTYLQSHGFKPASWEHQMLYDVFEGHDKGYDPSLSLSDLRRYREMLVDRLFSSLHITATREEIVSHADAIWDIIGPSHLEVFPEVTNVLSMLRGAGYPLIIISNWQSGLCHFVDELGLGGYFKFVVCSADMGVEKPDREIFDTARELLGVPATAILHIGDTYSDDFEGGYNAGMETVLVDRVQEGRLVASVSNLSELLPLLLKVEIS